LLLFAAAGVAALIGKREVSEATPPKPEQAAHEIAVDKEAVTEAARRGFAREGAGSHGG
jgi:hypothetical protein